MTWHEWERNGRYRIRNPLDCKFNFNCMSECQKFVSFQLRFHKSHLHFPINMPEVIAGLAWQDGNGERERERILLWCGTEAAWNRNCPAHVGIVCVLSSSLVSLDYWHADEQSEDTFPFPAPAVAVAWQQKRLLISSGCMSLLIHQQQQERCRRRRSVDWGENDINRLWSRQAGLNFKWSPILLAIIMSSSSSLSSSPVRRRCCCFCCCLCHHCRITDLNACQLNYSGICLGRKPDRQDKLLLKYYHHLP